jgi:leucine-zipper of insertion element IS481
MNEKAEARLRRKAMRMLSVGQKPGEVLKQVGRGRGWLSKWRTRYHHQGLAGLRGRSRRPHRLPQAWSTGMTRMIAQTRRRLSKAKAGLIGGHAIVNELRKLLPRQRLPSEKTVYRKLHQTGLIASPKPTTPPYYPWPTDELPTQASLDALDWTCRFLEGGAKVYAFHTLNLRTLELHQTLADNKTLETAQQHVLEAWKNRGIPHFLQLDNDAIFCGGYNVERVMGQFVRLCLWVGIELIFTPFKEPQHNFQVEQLNGLWGGPAFWRRHHFRCLGDVRRLAPAFTDWYMHTYTPPTLHGNTPAEHHATEHRPHLNHAMTRLIPPALPITSGRIHFIRHVQTDGTIRILNEIWPIGKRLAGQYVWATITTHRHTLDIWHRRNANRPWRLIKHIHYDLGEPVHRPLQPFIDLFTMS